MIRFIYSVFMNAKFKYKLIFCFSLIIIISTTAITVYLYNTASLYVYSELKSNNELAFSNSMSFLEMVAEETEYISTVLCTDSSIQSELKEQSRNHTALNTNTINFISTIFATNNYLGSVQIYSNSEQPYYYSFNDMSRGASSLSTLKRTPLYRQAVQASGAPVWDYIEAGESEYMEYSAYPRILLCRIIKDNYSQKTIGALILGIRLDAISNKITALIPSEGALAVLDADHRILFSSSEIQGEELRSLKKTSGTSTKTTYSDNSEYIYTYGALPSFRWLLVYEFSISPMLSLLFHAKTISFLIVIISLILAVLVSIYLSNILTSPLQKLLCAMRNFRAGDFNSHVNFSFYDEIGELGKGYDEMVDETRRLIANTWQLELKNREAELASLQAQINPHFLYNTLDSIYWHLMSKNTENAAQMIILLSKIFRQTLSQGKSFISVSSELELVANYLSLQQMIMHDRLHFDITVSPDAAHIMIPKLIIQPFVENSVIHGLQPTSAGGYLSVKTYIEQQQLVFLITDNGIGCSTDSLEELFEKTKDRTNYSGFAVKNVYSRLKIQYENKCDIAFSSHPGKTEVIIRLPLLNAETVNSEKS